MNRHQQYHHELRTTKQQRDAKLKRELALSRACARSILMNTKPDLSEFSTQELQDAFAAPWSVQARETIRQELLARGIDQRTGDRREASL